jgi:tetratricopeptide (TPR) repeat protein
VVLGGLGAAHFQRREIEIARQFFDRQLALSREIGDRLGEGKALLSLSEIALETDNRVLAADLARQALVITSSHGDVLGQGTAHYRLALAHAAAGDLRKAASSADRASQLLQEIQLPILGEVEGKLAEWSR